MMEGVDSQRLIGELIGLARATEGNEHLISDSATATIAECLAALDSLDAATLARLLRRVEEEKRKMVPNCFCCAAPCGRNNAYNMQDLQQEEPYTRQLKQELLTRLTCGIPKDPTVLYTALIAIGIDGIDPSILETILQKL